MYSDYIRVKNDIQKSVNIEFDFGNVDLINNFVPTSDTCNTLKSYIQTILGMNSDFATTLIGPYGKGKSYLILVLSEILCVNDIKKIMPLMNKIDGIDPELNELIRSLIGNRKRLLPVVINSNYNDLEQAFLISLKSALEREEMSDIYPDTAFSVCLKVLENWINDQEYFSKKIIPCLENISTTSEELISGLKSYSQKSLDEFKEIYRCVSYGLEFNPLANGDVLKIFEQVSYKVSKYGYCGLFLIFDEFSKAIDSDRGSYDLSRKLKFIQDVAELANRSTLDRQIHIAAITHKNLRQYADGNSITSMNSFQAVEGRFKERQLSRTMTDSYQLIAYSLERSPNYEELYSSFLDEYREVFKDLLKIEVLSGAQIQYLLSNCLPMSPLTVWVILKISELIAQNDRTLFTLLADTDEHSFSTFLKTKDSGFYGAPQVFDYFRYQFDETQEIEIRTVFRKALSAIESTETVEAQNILKALALLKILNNPGILPTEKNISRLLSKPFEEVHREIQEMLRNDLIWMSVFDDSLDFSDAVFNKIQKKVELSSAKAVSKSNLLRVIESIRNESVIIPNRYNLRNRITRYLRIKSITEQEFLDAESVFDFSSEVEDGLVVNVFCDLENVSEIIEKFSLLQFNTKIILRIVEDLDKDLTSKIQAIYYLDRLRNDELFTEQETTQIRFLKNDYLNSVKSEVSKRFDNSIVLMISDGQVSDRSHESIQSLAGELCKNSFPKTPIVNNELINRKKVASGYVKPLNYFIDNLLNKTIDGLFLDGKTKTTPEIMIYRAFFHDNTLNSDSREIVDEIKSLLLNNIQQDEKISIRKVFNLLHEEPYGIKKGLIAPYLALTLNETIDNPVLYFKKQQILLNGQNLTKAIENPEDYFLLFSKSTIEREQYLSNLAEFYHIQIVNSFSENLELIFNAMRKQINSLPIIIRESKLSDNFLGLDETFIEYKNTIRKFDINTYDFIFNYLPSLFNGLYKNILLFVEKISLLSVLITQYEEKISQNISKQFSDDSSKALKNSYENWKFQNQVINYSSSNENISRKIYLVFERAGYDNSEIINNLSKVVTGRYINEWTSDQSSELYQSISSLKESILSQHETNQNYQADKTENLELTPFGQLLKNAIDANFSEFGSSVSDEEKIRILKNILSSINGR